MICLSMCSVWSFLCVFEHGFSQYQRLLSSLIEVPFAKRCSDCLILPWDEYVVSSGVVYVSIGHDITLLLFIIWPEKCPAVCSSFASERVRLQASVRLPCPRGPWGEVLPLFLSTCNVSNDLIFAYFCFCLRPPNLALTIVFFNVSIDMLFGMAGLLQFIPRF